jgi:putative SOS response-associated peptidase YedK
VQFLECTQRLGLHSSEAMFDRCVVAFTSPPTSARSSSSSRSRSSTGPNTAPSWNVTPTDPLPIIRYDARAGERSMDLMPWGLVPFWAKDIRVGFSNIKAKGSEVITVGAMIRRLPPT